MNDNKDLVPVQNDVLPALNQEANKIFSALDLCGFPSLVKRLKELQVNEGLQGLEASLQQLNEIDEAIRIAAKDTVGNSKLKTGQRIRQAGALIGLVKEIAQERANILCLPHGSINPNEAMKAQTRAQEGSNTPIQIGIGFDGIPLKRK